MPGGAATPLAPTDPGDLSLLSCSDDSNCVLFGGVTVTYWLQGLQRLPRQCPPDGCVLHEEATWQPDVASTADGGRDWHVSAPTNLDLGSFRWNYTPGEPGYPSRVTVAAAGPNLGTYDLSCTSARDCWLSGEGPTGLLATADGGAHWSRQPFSGHKQGLLQVSCPLTAQCVALGAPRLTIRNSVPFQDNSVPVYSNIATSH